MISPLLLLLPLVFTSTAEARKIDLATTKRVLRHHSVIGHEYSCVRQYKIDFKRRKVEILLVPNSKGDETVHLLNNSILEEVFHGVEGLEEHEALKQVRASRKRLTRGNCS